jgi:hypothetical protein
VIRGVKHFRPYLYGRQFKLRTDHASLRWLCRRKEPSDQVARWLEALSEYSFVLKHRAGVKHGNADGLSRQSCTNCKQCDRIERRDGGPSRQEITRTEGKQAPNRLGTLTFPGEEPRDCRQAEPKPPGDTFTSWGRDEESVWREGKLEPKRSGTLTPSSEEPRDCRQAEPRPFGDTLRASPIDRPQDSSAVPAANVASRGNLGVRRLVQDQRTGPVAEVYHTLQEGANLSKE